MSDRCRLCQRSALRSVLLPTRVSPANAQLVRRAVKKSGRTLSAWAGDVLVRAAKREVSRGN